MKVRRGVWADEKDTELTRLLRTAPTKVRLTPFFAGLIHPLRPDAFMKKHFEKKLLLCKPSAKAWSHPAFKRDLLELLKNPRVRSEKLRLFGADSREIQGKEKQELWERGAIDSLVRAGRASLSINGIERFAPTYRDLKNVFQDLFKVRVGINCYITPAGKRTLPRHWDGHDVFIFQVSGVKRWTIHSPLIELPLDHQTATGLISRTPITKQVDLKPGQLLYVPRGVPHQCESLRGISQHITLGLDPLRWHEVFVSMAETAAKACQADLMFRLNAESYTYGKRETELLFEQFKARMISVMDAQSPFAALARTRVAKRRLSKLRMKQEDAKKTSH